MLVLTKFPAKWQQSQWMFSYATDAAASEMLFGYDKGQLNLLVHDQNVTSGTAPRRSVDYITDRQYHHIAATYSTITGEIKLYVDGGLVGTGLVPAANRREFPGDGELVLGARQAGKRASFGHRVKFVGKMTEVRVWRTVRSQNEIMASMHRMVSASESGLAAYYRMLNQGTGSARWPNAAAIVDSTTNGNDLKLWGTYEFTWVPAGNLWQAANPHWTIAQQLPLLACVCSS
jgi:hypothetical protein